MRFGLRTLLPGQFGLFALFIVTTLSAIALGVICLPSSAPEKMLALMALCQCLWCYHNRNYLHPQQGTLPYTARRRMAVSDFVGSTMIWPPVFIWFYFWRGYRSSHVLWFSDLVFCGSYAMLFAAATWKLIRALQPKTLWTSTI